MADCDITTALPEGEDPDLISKLIDFADALAKHKTLVQCAVMAASSLPHTDRAGRALQAALDLVYDGIDTVEADLVDLVGARGGTVNADVFSESVTLMEESSVILERSVSLIDIMEAYAEDASHGYERSLSEVGATLKTPNDVVKSGKDKLDAATGVAIREVVDKQRSAATEETANA